MRRLTVAALLAALCTACSGAPAGSSPSGQQVVARVAGTAIPAALFQVRLRSTLTAVAQAGGPTGNATMTSQVRASVLRSLLFDTVIAQEAAAAHVAASPAEISAQVAADAQSAGGLTQLQTQLASIGGSLTQLDDEVRSSLNEQKLEDALAQQRAATAEQKLASGAPFAATAATYSDDSTTAASSGELGLVSRSKVAGDDPAYAAGVLALKAGQWTNPPIRDAQGYDIVQLESSTPAALRLRHIIVTAPKPYTVKERPAWFAEAIFEALAQDCAAAKIHIYIGNVGDNPCAAVAASASPRATATP